MTATKVFTLQAREWAEADQPAVHDRNMAAVRRSLHSQRIPFSDVRFLAAEAHPDGASVNLVYEVVPLNLTVNAEDFWIEETTQ